MKTAAKTRKTIVKNDLILRAIEHESIPRPPVWMMRQAGRYLPEYRAIRENFSFLELCKNVDAATEVSLQPYRILGVDAIIMFSDILVLFEPMGAAISFDTGAPKILEPIRSKSQIDSLVVPEDIEGDLSYVFEILGSIKNELTTNLEATTENMESFQGHVDKFLQGTCHIDSAGRSEACTVSDVQIGECISIQEVPVLGFSGAPWTLASYLIEGGGSKEFKHIKSLMYSDPETMHSLLDKLARTVSNYLKAKLKNGADAVQLFDTWAGQLSRKDYEEFAHKYQKQIIEDIRGEYPDAKIILYVNGAAPYIDYMAGSGVDVLSVDQRVNLTKFRRAISSGKYLHMHERPRKLTIQGNLDPCVLLGSKENVIKTAQEMLTSVNDGNPTGYIANLGHGIVPEVPVENAQAFIDAVKGFSY